MIFLCALCSLLFTIGSGCVNPPATKIKGEVNGKPFSLESPKQVDMKNFKLHCAANGDVDLSIEQLGSTNSPDVIQTTGAAQVGMINAVGNVAAQVASQVVQGIATGGAAQAVKAAIQTANQPSTPSITNTNK